MLVRSLFIGAATVAMTTAAAAQERGTLELGVYGNRTKFDPNLVLNDAWGGGGRIGLYLTPRINVEFEGGVTAASRPLGLDDVNVGNFVGRVTIVPFKLGPVAILLGGGLEHTNTDDFDSYGVQALAGAKFAMNRSVDVRIDATYSDLEGNLGVNRAVRAGLSIYRHPFGKTRTVVQNVPAPMRQDSVSAEETRRLRAVAAQYQMLRDSVNRAPRAMTPAPAPTPAVSSTAALATMEQVVYFSRDDATLSDSAKMILDEKVVVFKANPNMKIVVVGNASQPGTAPYNMALGLRRAEASKAYLVSKGVDAGRIEIATKGEGQLAVDGDDMAANAANRRSQFRLLVADPFLRRP